MSSMIDILRIDKFIPYTAHGVDEVWILGSSPIF